MLAQLAVGARLRVRIQLLAVILDRLHREGLLCGLHRQVHTGIIVVRDRFYILIALMELIALATEVTADIVHDTAAAIFILRYASDHRISPRISVIIPTEHKVKARLFNRRDNLRRCRNRLCAINRLMGYKNFPDAVSGQVFGNIGKGLRQFRSVVNSNNTNLTILHLVPTILGAFGQVVERTADLTVCVAVVLMVAHNMDHVHTAQRFAVDRGQEGSPVFNILRYIVNSIAGLDSKIIDRFVTCQILKDMAQVGSIRGLNIAEDKEVGRLSPCRRHLKALRIRPCLPVTHLIVIGRAGLQPCKGHLIAPQSITMAALHKGLNGRVPLHRDRIGQVICGRIFHESLCCRTINLGKPSYALNIWLRYSIGHDAKGFALVLRRPLTDDHPLIPRTPAVGLFRIEGILTLSTKGIGQFTLHICFAKLGSLIRIFVYLIDICTGNRLSLCIRHSQRRRHSGNDLLTAKLIPRRQCDLLLRAGEGIGLAALRAVVNGIVTLRDGVSQRVPLRGVRGDVDDKVSQLRHIVIFSCGFRSEEPCQQ